MGCVGSKPSETAIPPQLQAPKAEVNKTEIAPKKATSPLPPKSDAKPESKSESKSAEVEKAPESKLSEKPESKFEVKPESKAAELKKVPESKPSEKVAADTAAGTPKAVVVNGGKSQLYESNSHKHGEVITVGTPHKAESTEQRTAKTGNVVIVGQSTSPLPVSPSKVHGNVVVVRPPK
mmetsp:Transcript_23992/g.33016  ORF Transcript_23992/g.33016 Transcript_23992/m.33016 type:complete len:179 (+) Transcript_23992:139-675(+)|eukprot:CAMPEP_0196593700 /NCGR_PEP_ID=MMETSP1081-20130531/76291_1 /TAXON_ID=36882 /ORGANISM="Pyramimonas amylifera, Strain CCMP720" /LENGTH=178 /DNA_ID=CAMNT_0041917755 /DNA_START=133 /DNA_END=669 /DNA_ORIENTATION=-